MRNESPHPAPAFFSNRLFADARHGQIVVLGSLLLYGFFYFSAPPVAARSMVMAASALLTQVLFTRLIPLPRFDFRSPLITSFSLSILLRPDSLELAALAGCLAIASKFLLAPGRRHLFNPAAFSIAVLSLCTERVWVSPGQWGTALWLVFTVACMGLVVTQRATRLDISLAFLIAYAAGIFGRAIWLGDPMSIPLRQLQSGAVILFAFFMISDPKTTPDRRSTRILFGIIVALLAVILQYNWIHPIYYGLFYALIFSAPLVPLMNKWAPGTRFQWQPTPPDRSHQGSPHEKNHPSSLRHAPAH